jgi:hypothetical protein
MPRWVTQNTRRCPRSEWNAVRDQPGTVSAITAECCPPSERNGVRDGVEYAQEGINLLRSLRVDLSRTRSAADFWGTVAVLANLTLIPLNCIVNAFELKDANSLYQALVRQLYGKYSKSGSRLDGNAKVALSLLKQAIVQELKRKALTDYVPGVNILVGLAEDSLAAWRAIQLVDSGASEIAAIAADVDRKIVSANHQLIQLGIKRAEILGRLQVNAQIRARTA